jgi:hypothetical protein
MENSLSINNIKKSDNISDFFRKKLVELGYHKFNGKKIKGEICYDAYYKDFLNINGVKYTIYCYCYDVKDLIETPDLFEFSFEVQINAGLGIIVLEAIQWDFRSIEKCEENVREFEEKTELVWKSLGSINFPD